MMRRNATGLRIDGSTAARDADGRPLPSRFFAQSSFAGHAIATARNVVKVDDDIPLELLGPLGCGLQTGAGSVLNSLSVRYGESIAVFGCGGVGLAAVMAARAAGATTVIAVDLHANRRELALEVGATHTIDGAAGDIVEQLTAISGPLDYGFDTTGANPVINNALRALRPDGTLGLVSGVPGPLTIEPGLLSTGRRLAYLIEGDAEPRLFIPQLIALYRQGRFPFDKLVKTYPLSGINDAERDSTSGQVVKPVLLPGA